ncbi:DUF2207 domain-containing protein [Cyanobium sp. FGCU-52]|nr:DUF2207 domain-containing protein [Cyanobium sp. FGCU52]
MPGAYPRQGVRRLAPWLALLLAAGLGVLLLLPGGTGLAQVAQRQLQLQSFAMDAQVARDGSLQIVETLTARFQGRWNGLRREIPELANRPGGVEPLGLRLLSASGDDGRPYRVETSHEGENLMWRIFVPGAEDATRTVVLRYRVANGVRHYPDHDELNWNVTGNAWEIPIDQVRAMVRLPEGAQGVHASVYTGPQGARGKDALLTIGPREVTAVSTRRLEPGEGLTLAVGFDKGLVTAPSAPARLLGWLRGRLALLLPLITALILGSLWWRVGRDPALGPVTVVYEPPGGLPPAVLGSLVKQSVASENLGATLVDLAVKGHLQIEQLDPWLPFLPLPKHYRFTLRTTLLNWRDMAPHELYLIERLFPSPSVGATVDTDDLRDCFYVHVPGFEELVRQAVLAQGFYRRWPATVRGITLLAGLAIAIAVVVLAVNGLLLPPDLARLQLQADPLLSLLALLVTLLLIVRFAWIMPRRTLKGVETLRQTLGFQEFLRRVDAPRFNAVIRTPELFERFLPYAMVAGQTRRWTDAFRGILQQPPDWYVSSHNGFDIGDFGSSLEDCCTTTSHVMQSSPSSSGSSSSGSSGGGSSGGGDGGGGGGGF